MRTIAPLFFFAAAALVACTDPLGSGEPATGSATAAQTQTTQPPDLCDEVNHEPVPRPGGSCTFEISLDSVTNVSGQGFSETDMEVNLVASASGAGGSTKAWPGSLPDVHDNFVPETTVDAGKGYVLGTYTVAAGSQKQVKLCASFTEVDNGGANGVDDVGSDCDWVTLTATLAGNNKVLCTASPRRPVVDVTVCGDNQCNGRFSANYEVMVKDADLDGVENEDDFTPDVCDEEEKGQLGRASLVWFYMGDGPMTDFFQHFGTDLSKALDGYDYRVVIIDPASAGPFLSNPQALKSADLVLDPYEDNLYEAMREITRRGYDMDIWIWSHGEQITFDGVTMHTRIMSLDTNECTPRTGDELCGNDNDDNGDGNVDELPCIPPPGTEICWNDLDDDGDGVEDNQDGVWDTEIAENLAPALIGTDLVPIRMVYSIACFNEGMNWAWRAVGAYVTSGALAVNFFPVFYGGFADAWNNSSSYLDSVAASDKPGDRFLVESYLEVESAGFNCDDLDQNGAEELLPVMGLNDCARDFFVDDGANDEAVHNLGSDYDPALSGEANIDAQSLRVIDGDPMIEKYVPLTLVW